jgi:hypothetical protein
MDIRPVNSKRDWKDFYRVKCDIYRDDPAAVIPLRSMEYTLLDDTKHPFYQHAQRQAYVAYQNNKPVARIVAIKDDLHNEHYGDRVGFFGFFECPDDQELADALIETAKDWLKERGLDVIRGPVNPSMKSEFGVLVDGHEHPPFIMLAHSRKYYAKLLESAGFQVARKFVALLMDVPKDLAETRVKLKRMFKFADRVHKRFPNLRIELATRENVSERIRAINIVGNEIRSEGWGFVPMTNEELDFMVSQVKRIIRPQTVVSVFIGDELAGYHVSIPDINWAIKRAKGPDWLRYLQLPFLMKRIPQSRCIALGASRKHRNSGVGLLAALELCKVVDSVEKWEFSWIDAENRLSISTVDHCVVNRRYKIYHLYEKPIADSL